MGGLYFLSGFVPGNAPYPDASRLVLLRVIVEARELGELADLRRRGSVGGEELTARWSEDDLAFVEELLRVEAEERDWQAAQNYANFDHVLVGLLVVLAVAAYRSRKRRLLGLRPDTHRRVLFEAGCLVASVFLFWTILNAPAIDVAEDPVPFLVMPVWGLLAYPLAGLRPSGRSKTS